MSEPEQQAQLAPEQRIAAAISYDDKCIGLVGYRLTDEQVEKIVRVVLTAARVEGCPAPERAPWTGRRLFEFFEHEAERGRGWPRLINLGKHHWENLAARIEGEIADAGCPDEGQRTFTSSDVEAIIDAVHDHGRGAQQAVEHGEIEPEDQDALPPTIEAAIVAAEDLVGRPLGAVAASPDEGFQRGWNAATDRLLGRLHDARDELAHEHDLLLKERDPENPGSLAYQLRAVAASLPADERTHYVFPDAEDAGNENATACGSLPLAEPSREVARVDCLQCLRLLAVAGVAGPADEGLRAAVIDAADLFERIHSFGMHDLGLWQCLGEIPKMIEKLGGAATGCLPEDEGLWITSDEGEACLEALRALPDGCCCEECDRCEARKTVRAKLEPPRVGDKDPT